MKRIGIWALAGFAIACSHGPRPQPTPEPAAQAGPAEADPIAAPAPMAVAGAHALPDTGPAARAAELLDSAGAADSAADAAILEQLATSHPEARDSGLEDPSAPAASGGANAVATPEVTYDIDVATYGSHSRVKYYLDFFQGPARERMSVWLQRMPRYEPMIRAKLREYQVPEDMVYLALIESGYSNTATSRARATGMWQFMKGTAKLYGLKIDSWIDERRDPVRATDAAARHLADLRDQFGSMYLAAAAYNAGAGKVGRGLRRLGPDEEEDEEENPDATFFRLYDTRFLRRETKDYVPKLIAAALIAKQPEKYGFDRGTGIEPLVYDSIIVPDATGLDVLARLADTSVAALRDLNPQYLRLVTPPRRESVVRLPAGSGAQATERFASLPAKSRVTYVDHVVTRGQTMGSIGRIYRVSARLIIDANPGVRASRLRPGSHLLIPTSFVPPSSAEPALRAGRVGAGHGGTTIRYRVRSGESLWLIAGRYNTTVERLRSLNALSRSEPLRAGQVIRVPAAVDTVKESGPAATTRIARAPTDGARTHRVRRGETLSGIAARYGVGLSALQAANGLDQDSVLKAGARLVIPD
jgi:membrane-bound lytic murein transglycosylase D